MTNVQARVEEPSDPAMGARIKAIAADVFQVQADGIELAMGPDDIDRWDSLNHLRLITEIESAFSIRLTMQQIQQIETLRDFVTFVSEGNG